MKRALILSTLLATFTLAQAQDAKPGDAAKCQ